MIVCTHLLRDLIVVITFNQHSLIHFSFGSELVFVQPKLKAVVVAATTAINRREVL
jgi:hypothetical protein